LHDIYETGSPGDKTQSIRRWVMWNHMGKQIIYPDIAYFAVGKSIY